MLFHSHYGIVRARRVIPTARRIKRRDKRLPKFQKPDNYLLQGVNLFLPFCLLLLIMALPLLVSIRARKPLLRLRFRFEIRVIFLCVAMLCLQKDKRGKHPHYFTKSSIIAISSAYRARVSINAKPMNIMV